MSSQIPDRARVVPLRPVPASPPGRAEREPLWRDLVGEVLRRERLAQDRTLKDVAEAARISMPYLSELERGRKEASSEVLAAAARALGLNLAELLALTHRRLAGPAVRRPAAPGALPALPGTRDPRTAGPGAAAPVPAPPGRTAPGAVEPGAVEPVAEPVVEPVALPERPAASRPGHPTATGRAASGGPESRVDAEVCALGSVTSLGSRARRPVRRAGGRGTTEVRLAA